MSQPKPSTETEPHASLRAELRGRAIAAREALSHEEQARLSAALEQQLEPFLNALTDTASIRTLGFCWPFRAEFDARPLVTRWLSVHEAHYACLPIVLERTAPLAFRAWVPKSEMAEGRHGIHIPSEGEALQPDAILIPLNAFDEAGYRLGYGGGYFDRTLASLQPRPLAIGVGFELARMQSIYPQAHDLHMDYIVTEAGVFAATESALQRIDVLKQA